MISHSWFMILATKLSLGLVFDSFGQVQPTDKFQLPPPEKCPSGSLVCGDDPGKYPVQEIDRILRQSIELRISPETTDRFFKNGDVINQADVVAEHDLCATCDVRSENLPRFPRMKNVLGDLVYLAEGNDQKRQNVKLTYCAQAEAPCKNDPDSHSGEGSTVCKQLFRYQKLLAVDRKGEVIVDTFKYPSACVCHYKEQFGSQFLRSGFAGFNRLFLQNPPVCTKDVASQTLKTFNDFNQVLPISDRLKIEKGSSKVDPCPNKSLICDSEDQDYPEKKIHSVLSAHVAFKSTSFFEKLFGDTCRPDEGEDQFDDIGLRGLFDTSVTNLCSSSEKYLYPKKAKNQEGQWLYIINTDKYRQGVLINECSKYSKDSPCLYGGADGVNPEIKTTCKQLYSDQYFLALNWNGTVVYEGFPVPSSCSCYIKH